MSMLRRFLRISRVHLEVDLPDDLLVRARLRTVFPRERHFVKEPRGGQLGVS